MNTRIYLSPPHMGGAELDFIHDAVSGNWIAPLGPNVDGFNRGASLPSGTAMTEADMQRGIAIIRRIANP